MHANKEVETINSFELATVIGKGHPSVRSAIERNIVRGLITAGGPIKIDIDSAYRAIQVYILDKQDSIRLCEKVNRWNENLIYAYWANRAKQPDPAEDEAVEPKKAVMLAMQEVEDAMAKLRKAVSEYL